MHLYKKLVSVLLSAAMVFSIAAPTIKDMAGSARITTVKAAANSTSVFDSLNQDEIVSEMGAGWNLGNQLEAVNNGTPGETNWGNPVITENLVKAVKNAGFDTIRIPVSYFNYIGSGPNYTIDAAWLDRIQEVVDMCMDNGLYAIINMHGDGYTSMNGWLLCASSDQTAIKEKYRACWQQIANRFKNYDEHVIFESMNEEFDGSYGVPDRTAYSNINAYNQIFVDTVRQTGANNDDRWLLIPGWNTNIDYTVGDYGFVIPSDTYRSSSIPSSEKRIMVSVHYYDPWDFCGNESDAVTQWGSTVTNTSKEASWGNESHMASQFEKTYHKFVQSGYPVVVGEYGSIDKSNGDYQNKACRAEYAKKLCTYSKQYGIVPVLWDNGYNGNYGFGVFDRNSCAVTQQGIIDAIMTVYPDNGSGSVTTSPSPSATVSSSPSPSPSAAVSPSPSPSPSATVSPSPSPSAAGLPSGITCDYSVTSDWGSSFMGEIVLKNNSNTTYNGWTLTFDYDSTITSLWNAEFGGQTNQKVTVKNPSWSASFAPGSSVTICFIAQTGSGKNAPASYTFS